MVVCLFASLLAWLFVCLFVCLFVFSFGSWTKTYEYSKKYPRRPKRALARFKDLNEHLKDKFGSPRQWKLRRVSVGVYLKALCG